MSGYFFFADESGHVTQEPGISDEIGPSRYLAMGGCLISTEEYEAVVASLNDLQKRFKKTNFLHATGLSHVQKIHFAGELLKLGIPVFGVVSDKTTLLGFKDKSNGPQDYYNRTALYLLNLLGRHLKKPVFLVLKSKLCSSRGRTIMRGLETMLRL